ncbi:MAG: type II secretion system protein [Pseudomonadota bacterium]
MMRRRPEKARGFTLIEVLVTLLLASIVLSAAFQITIAYAQRNARLSAQLDALAGRDASEKLYRAMLAGFAPRVQELGSPPPKEIVFGDKTTLRGWASSEIEAGCVSTRNFQDVVIDIRENADGGGLYCKGDYGELQLISWTGRGASFSYSADGVQWTEQWPEPGTGLGFGEFEQRLSGGESLDQLLATRSSLRAPLVRLSFPAPGGEATWIARAGATQQNVRSRAAFEFETFGPEFEF